MGGFVVSGLCPTQSSWGPTEVQAAAMGCLQASSLEWLKGETAASSGKIPAPPIQPEITAVVIAL